MPLKSTWLMMVRFVQLEKYVRYFPYHLVDEFGIKRAYSPGKIRKVVEKYNYNPRYIALAYAAFCREADFNKIQFEYDVSVRYHELREIVGKKYLQGKTDFNICNILNHSAYKKGDKFWGYWHQCEENGYLPVYKSPQDTKFGWLHLISWPFGVGLFLMITYLGLFKSTGHGGPPDFLRSYDYWILAGLFVFGCIATIFGMYYAYRTYYKSKKNERSGKE